MTPSMTLTVHIGAGKTGTTSIQDTLSAAQAVLKSLGILYIGLMGEELEPRRFTWQEPKGWFKLIALRATASKELLEMLESGLDQARTAGLQHVIWSNEAAFRSDKLVIPVLAELQRRGVKVRIVAYVRRHDAWMRSAYFQWAVKQKAYAGPVKPFHIWYEAQKVGFYPALKPWLDGPWDDISIRNFDACPDVTVDFLSCIGLDPGAIPVVRHHETPNPVALALWAMHNSQSETAVHPPELRRLLHSSGILHREPVGVDWQSLIPTERDIQRVSEDSAEDRAKLNLLLAEHSQPEIDTTALKHKSMAVSQDQINAALLTLIKSQHDQIVELRAKISKLKPGL
jgi:hypothetical protein